MKLVIDDLNLDAFINFAVDPKLTQEVLKIQETLIKSPRRQEMIRATYDAVVADADFMKLYEDKYIPRFPTNDELRDCPKDSLGYAVFQHLEKNSIQLDFSGLDTSVFYQKELNPLTYLGTKSFRNHDVHHVVLGLSTSPVDEYCLFAVQLAQFASPYHLTALASGFLHVGFYDSSNISSFLKKLFHYYDLGTKIKLLPGYDFEANWKTPLAEVRRQLKIGESDLTW